MKRNGKAYRRLILSFALIFLIPILMSLIFYFYTYQTVRERADASNLSLLNTVKSTCDREMSFYENTLVQLALNSSVQNLSSVRTEFGSENSYELYTLYNELSSMYVSVNKNGDVCKDMFVYFKNSDKIVSTYGCMSFDMYCELYCGDEANMKTALKQELTEYHFRNAARMESGWSRENPVLLLTMTNLYGEYGETSAMVGMWLDMGALNRSIESVSWEEGLEWLILNSKGQAMNRSEEYPQLGISYEELAVDTEQKITWNGQDYIMRATASDTENWKYVLLMSESLISAQAGQIRNVFLLGILVCMGMVFLMAPQIMKVNYTPLKKIMDLFQMQDGAPEYVDNEYQYLENSAMSFFREYSDFRQKVAENKKVLRQYYLAGLLESPYDARKDTPDRAAVSVELEEGKNLVLLFCVQEKDGQDMEEAVSMHSLRCFIIRNVFEEGIGEYFQQETVELGDVVAMIVNLKEMQEDYTARLMEVVDSLQRFIRKNFGFDMAVLAGEPHEGLPGIHESYVEARKAEEFIDTLDADFIRYEEIKNSSREIYDYSQEQEGRIIQALASRNLQLASSYINKVLDSNFLENRLSPDMCQCLLYDLAGTLMKASEETGFPDRNGRGGIKTEWDLSQLTAKRPLEEIREMLLGMARDVSGEEEESGEENQNRLLCQEVLEYINANYSDPDLNISQTGQHFHMTPAYLSSIFRKEMGESLLKVITQTRVREAEKLLAAGVSVVDAGEQVGFRDSSTFIRTFKKYMGVTPGQIKGSK